MTTATATKTVLSVDTDALSNVLKTLSPVSSMQTGGGASNGILFSTHESDDGSLVLTMMATNGNVAALQKIELGSIDGDHLEFLVPAKLLNAVVASYPTGGSIELHVGNELEVVKGKLNYKLSTIPTSEFPVINFADSVVTHNTDDWTNAGGLFDVLDTVQIATANDKSTPYLNGVRVEKDGNDLVATSTDSYRMMREKYGPFKGWDTLNGQIVSRDLISLATKMFNDMEDITLIAFQDHLQFVNRDWTKISWHRGIKGNFPPVEKIIDADYPATLQVNTEELLTVLNRMKYIARDQHAKATITFKDNAMNVSVNTVDAQADEDVSIGRNDAEQWEKFDSIKFNFTHLIDGVSLYEGHDDLNISFNTPAAPARFWVEGERTEYLAMLMR